MNDQFEQRLITLESIVSCQDQMLDDLNNVVIDQNKTIYKLNTEIEKLRGSLDNLAQEPDNRPPPHY